MQPNNESGEVISKHPRKMLLITTLIKRRTQQHNGFFKLMHVLSCQRLTSRRATEASRESRSVALCNQETEGGE